MERILITGGAGFVGSSLALKFKEQFPKAEVVALDNLKRRGSELSLSRLRAGKITFVHGDVRVRDDLLSLPGSDLIIDCAAEPSAMAGIGHSPDYVVQSNLVGTYNSLELARRDKSSIIFLSTSRVYPEKAINQLKFEETPTRFDILPSQETPGASSHGIAEDFPLNGARSLYGATKLCSEILLTEYLQSYGLKGVINRCGVIAGPWQMGKVDQGIVVLWAAKHFFGGNLAYFGFGGTGKQVRDMLHVDDLFELLNIQINELTKINGEVFNIAGGQAQSLSLCELTKLCAKISGREISVSSVKEDRANDLKYYVGDSRKAKRVLSWSPRRNVETILGDIFGWLKKHESELRPILG